MSVHKNFVLSLILVWVLGLAACTPATPAGELPETGATSAPEVTPEVTAAPTTTQETQAVTPEVTLPATVPATASVTAPAGTQTPLAVDFETTEELVTALEAAGAEVEVTGAVDEPIFPVDAQNLTVNGQQVQVFEFADEATRQAAADTIMANGFIIGNMAVDWVGQPNFWSGGRLIVLYVGEDETLISLISSLMGDPITGAELAGEGLPPAAMEAQRWLAEELGITDEDIPILNAEQVDWQDSCLGLGGPAESCAQVITPGWRVTIQVGDQVYEVRTNEDASVVRLGPASPAGAAPTATP